MNVKTCEEYVLEQLYNAIEKLAQLQSESESRYQDWNELQKDYRKLLDKYDTLRQALYESLEEIVNPELPYMTFKTHVCLYNDDPNYLAIKEAIDSYAREIGETDKGEPR